MIKEARQSLILKLINEKKFVKISEFQERLQVTNVTIRRDLQELEEMGNLVRLHGGAASNNSSFFNTLELSHNEKKKIHLEEKREIAQKIANEIQSNEVVFLGAGTTIETAADYLNSHKNLKIITNSFPLFNKIRNFPNLEIILIGGSYREKTGCFVGTITNDMVESLHVQKAFIGVNAIFDNDIYNANEEEGVTQRKILNNAEYKYIVSDSSKINKKDFYKFYSLEEADFLMVDSLFPKEYRESYQSKIQLI